MSRILLFSSACVVPLALSAALPLGEAKAQEAASPQAGIDTIIVTAQRREANVQDVSAAITALSGEDVVGLGVLDASNLNLVSPGIHTNVAGANFMQLYVRGVGNFAANAFAEGAVALNYDGVYVSRPTTYSGLFYDLERIEVLKGPQGTLYGRNATGGAVNLITRRPDLGGGVSGYLMGEFGNYDHVQVTGALNASVSETFALRGAFQVLERDGFYADGTDDAGSWGARVSALVKPADDVSIVLSVDRQEVDNRGGGGTLTGPTPFVPGDFLTDDPFDVAGTSPEANALLAIFGRAPLGDPPPSNDLEVTGVTAQLDWGFDLATLTVLAGYREADHSYVNYTPGFLIDIDEQSEQTSVEARLASRTDAALRWVAGAYYFDEEVTSASFFLQQLLVAPPGQNSTFYTPVLGTQSWAVFGELTWGLTDSFRLIGGVRYTEEQKTMSGTNTTRPPFLPPAIFTLVGDTEFEKLTWKAGAEADLAPDNLLYFTVGTGFKAGGFYAEDALFGNTFEPETLTAYALGSKNRFFGNTLQANVEIFYWDYEDHQESHLTLSPGGYAIFQTENIGQAEIWGVDFEGEWAPTDTDTFFLQLQYLDAEFTEFSYSAFSPGGAPLVGCPFTALGGPFFVVNCDGFPAIRAPEWRATVGYAHTFELGDAGSLDFNLHSEISGGTPTSIDYRPSQFQDSYTRTDSTLAYSSPGGHWSFAGWVRNIEDSRDITTSFSSPFTPLTYGQLRPPRTYGVRLQVDF